MTREEAIETIKRNCTEGSQLREACAMFIPELKENEDERIRKEINTLYSDINTCISELLKARTDKDSEAEGKALFKMEGLMVVTLQDLSCIEDYLEKQKERGPLSKDEEYTLARIIEYLEDNDCPSEWKDLLHDVYSLPYQKEQKPLEWSEDFEDNIRNLLHDKLTWHSEDGSMSTTVFIDNKTLKDIVSGIWFYVGKEALKYPNKEIHVSEWSEEDEKMVRFYEADYNNQIGDMPMIDVINMRLKFKNWLANRLKSLHPQPHTVSVENATKFGNLEYERGVKDGIQSEKSRHWKPNKEQMGSLNYAYCELFKREDVGHNILGPLQNLIDTLSKL